MILLALAAVLVLAAMGLVILDQRRQAARLADALEAERIARDSFFAENPVPVFLVNSDGLILQSSSSVKALLGADPSGEMVHRYSPVDTHHGKTHPELVDGWFKSPRTSRLIGEAVRHDGSRFPADISITPVHLREETFAAVALQDATDRDAATRLDATTRQRDLAQLASHTTQHELSREALKIAEGWEMFTDPEAPDELQTAGREMVEDTIPLLREALNTTRVMVELGVSERVTDPVPVTLEDFAAVQTGLDVDVDTDGSAVMGDPDLLRLVWRNIARNAERHGKATTIAVHQRGGAVTVSDNGEGMHTDDFAEAWESGRRAGGGTGRGLAIIRRAVEAMGGRVTASSDVGQGVTFMFDLPEAP